jgi:hypothetical protein
MDVVEPLCWPWSTVTRRLNVGSNPRYPGWFGDMGGAGILSFTIQLNDQVTCPSEKIGKALRGRYGGYVDSFQFVCDDYNK